MLRAVAVALLLVQQIFGAAYAPLTQQAIETPVNRWLARIGYRQLLAEVEPTQRRLGTVSIHASQILLMPGSAFKMVEILRQVEAALFRG